MFQALFTLLCPVELPLNSLGDMAGHGEHCAWLNKVFWRHFLVTGGTLFTDWMIVIKEACPTECTATLRAHLWLVWCLFTNTASQVHCSLLPPHWLHNIILKPIKLSYIIRLRTLCGQGLFRREDLPEIKPIPEISLIGWPDYEAKTYVCKQLFQILLKVRGVF